MAIVFVTFLVLSLASFIFNRINYCLIFRLDLLERLVQQDTQLFVDVSNC